MSCPTDPYALYQYCKFNEGSSCCLGVGGVVIGGGQTAGGGAQRPADMFLAAAKLFQRFNGVQWQPVTQAEVDALQQEFQQAFPNLPNHDAAGLEALADFYRQRDYGLIELMYVDAIMQLPENAGQLAPVERFADRLRNYGFHEAALIGYRYAPAVTDGSALQTTRAMARLAQNEGRTLQLLGRAAEADVVFRKASKLSELAGRTAELTRRVRRGGGIR